MNVICEVIKLNPDRVKDYIDLHNKTWPELIKIIRNAGIVEEYIYILDNLVMVLMKCEDFYKTSTELLENKIFQEWDEKVRDMMILEEPFNPLKEAILDLEPVWRLDYFDNNGIIKE